jgi:signal transduction histidine kinase
MTNEPLPTQLAPAERAAFTDIQTQSRALGKDPLISAFLDCFPEPAMILNRQRQIVLANDKLALVLNRPRESLIGLRPGEAFGCSHSAEEAGGCGTSWFCRYCGAADAYVEAQRSAEPDMEEWRIQRNVDGRRVALDLRVWATPLMIDGESFTVFALRDTTDEKRRQLLEQIFFHDLLNTANALSLMLRILPELQGEEAVEMSQRAHRLVDELAEEIQSQRDLAAAERGDLSVKPEIVDAAQLLERVCASYRRRSIVESKSLVIRQTAERVVLESDERLLSRVLGNLIKNALEASEEGQTVTVSVHGGGAPTFRVHNETVMPEEVQAQVFQRSFTTKAGVGRGIGAYSIRLLTEEYLEGKVYFSSTVAEGTTFTVRLPARLHSAGAHSAAL